MTKLLIGLTGGLYRFDLDAGGSPGPLLPGVQPMAFAIRFPFFPICQRRLRSGWKIESAASRWWRG